MNARHSRSSEIFRICVMTLLGALLMWVTSLVFQSDALLGRMITKVDKDVWVASEYSFWATLIFVVSTVSTVLWYTLACLAPDRGSADNLNMRVPWVIFWMFPFIATVAFVFFNTNKEVEWFCILFFLFIGWLGYWFSTALNSPYPFTNIPLFAFELRQLFKL